jgi:hypothetical protein
MPVVRQRIAMFAVAIAESVDRQGLRELSQDGVRKGGCGMKFGDIIENTYAGHGNPLRYAMFLRYSGEFAILVDANGRETRAYRSDLLKESKTRIKVGAVDLSPLKNLVAAWVSKERRVTE